MSLTALQNSLQCVYEVDPGHRVEDYVITDPQVAKQLDRSNNARTAQEKLLIWQRGKDLRMSLYFDESILEALQTHQGGEQPSSRHLSDYCVAIEGVSHFLCVTWNARYGRHVTPMEMELQAEIDKFITVAQRWAGCSETQHALRTWLFENITFDKGLTADERSRYVHANSYAAKYCRWLQYEYLHQRRHREMLSELRRFYRMGRADKLRRIDSSS